MERMADLVQHTMTPLGIRGAALAGEDASYTSFVVRASRPACICRLPNWANTHARWSIISTAARDQATRLAGSRSLSVLPSTVSRLCAQRVAPAMVSLTPQVDATGAAKTAWRHAAGAPQDSRLDVGRAAVTAI
jgi:hypothetical protein